MNLRRDFVAAKEIFNRRKLPQIGVGVLFVLSAVFYQQIASRHSEFGNTDLHTSDQNGYLQFATQAYESDFQYTGDRNRMPLYPYLQALVYEPGMSDEDFFQRGKQFNILLSLVMLAVLFAVFCRFLPLIGSTNLTLISAFALFVFKAGYFQVELLF